MEKLLTLTPDALLSGRSRGKHDLRGGVWDTAVGLNPGINDDTYRGLMVMTASPTNITGSVVEDTPIAYCIDARASTWNAYILGDGGHFYSVDTNRNVSDLRDGANVITSPTGGIFTFQSRSATTPTLFYFRQTRLGSWDMSGTYPTGWSDTAVTVNTTVHHPVHRLYDTVYWGNDNIVGKTYDDGTATPNHDTNVLDFDGRETITAIGDDGRYLVIATSQTLDASYSGYEPVRIVWWATNTAAGSSWEWETSLPSETAVRKIYNTPNGLFAVTGRSVYQIAYGVKPKLIYTFDSDEDSIFDGLNYNYTNGGNLYKDGFIHGKKATAFARPFPNAESPVIHNPLHGHTGNISTIITDFKQDEIFYGTDSDRLYWINLAGAGSDSNETWTTRFFDLGSEYHLERVDLEMPNGIGASDTMTFSVLSSSGVSRQFTINEANHTQNEHYLRLFFSEKGHLTTSRVRFSFTLSAGLPSFGKLILYGTKAQ